MLGNKDTSRLDEMFEKNPNYKPPDNPTKTKIDYTHEIADRLESEAYKKCNREIEKAKAYCDGYIQGVEDYARQMIELLMGK